MYNHVLIIRIVLNPVVSTSIVQELDLIISEEKTCIAFVLYFSSEKRVLRIIKMGKDLGCLGQSVRIAFIILNVIFVVRF